MKVTKMEGCGNDFVLVEYKVVESEDLCELTKKLCDRHFGIGADGAIYVKENPLKFIYYNADGSSSPFCGNGMRCFAKYCRMNGLVAEDHFEVICGKWKVGCEINQEEITVKIPEVSVEIEEDGTEIIVVCGSRHKVKEVEFLDEVKETQSSEYNLNAVEWVSENEIRIKTIERGAGFTLACGSGSYVSAWKMHKKKKCNEKMVVKNAGGTIKIDVKRQEIKGTARKIYECEVNVNALKANETA